MIAAARGKTKQKLEILAAALAPRPDASDFLRALPIFPSTASTADDQTLAGEAKPPAPGNSLSTTAPHTAPLEKVEPLSPERFLFRFTGGAALQAKYARLTKLIGIKASGRMEDVFEAALDSLLDRLDPERRAQRRNARTARRTPRASSDSRIVPQALRDEVWRRDSGRCAFLNAEGLRCPATSWLEIDHIRPYALGGRSDDIDNLRLLCRAHNQLMARRIFGYPRG